MIYMSIVEQLRDIEDCILVQIRDIQDYCSAVT